MDKGYYPTINTPTNFGAAQSRTIAACTQFIMAFIQMGFDALTTSTSAADVSCNRIVLKFVAGTTNMLVETRSFNGKPFNVVFGEGRNAAGEKVLCQISQSAIVRAKDMGLVTEGTTGMIITTPGTVGSDGWYKAPALKQVGFNSANVEAAFAGGATNTVNVGID